ncbi:hypothetical protein BJY01DRAFT_55731 [Aspergillus pseudoustus]|uniref:IBR domain-containing protein n=1 Tax=Aspergillus pseudoustus TaxID=1810923 RepID=A0ABR4J904_9EURO
MAMNGPLEFPGLHRSNEVAFIKLDSWRRQSQPVYPNSSSTQLGSVQENKEEDPIRCVICHEQKQPAEITELSCRHRHCIDCVRTWADLYVSGQIPYPNFCCQKFEPAKSILPSIPEAEKQAFIDKMEEHRLPSHRRWYCPNPSCALWIRPKEMLVQGTAFSRSFACPHCKADICPRCRGRGHSGDCPADEGRAALLKLASVEGWKQCGHCGNLVDPVGEDGKALAGCKHVVCPCRVEIWYALQFTFAFPPLNCIN